MKKQRFGGELDDFLREEHLLEASEATAAKRVIAFQIEKGDEEAHAYQAGNGEPDDCTPRTDPNGSG